MNIIFSKRAENNLNNIIEYISEQGYPDSADNFLTRIEKFITTLKDFPNKFAICKQNSFKKRGFRCVPFESNYIVIYKQIEDDIIVYNIIHACKIR